MTYFDNRAPTPILSNNGFWKSQPHMARRADPQSGQLGGFLKDFFRKFSGRPHGKYAILMDIVKYEVVHMKI